MTVAACGCTGAGMDWESSGCREGHGGDPTPTSNKLALYEVQVWDRDGYQLGHYYTLLAYPWVYSDLDKTVPEYMTYGQYYDLTAYLIKNVEGPVEIGVQK